ncbi:MAG: hypothetical protein EAZ21_06090 [Betaproteobacteria bacterium]|nr:MAG: hypothetical protein EAZ21_06090 [Betaproteobacteria bacterium]
MDGLHRPSRIDVLYQSITIVPPHALALKIGGIVVPCVHHLAAWNGDAGMFTALVEWIQALGWPLIVGLPIIGPLFTFEATHSPQYFACARSLRERAGCAKLALVSLWISSLCASGANRS